MKKILLTITMLIAVMTLFFALGTTAYAETYGVLTYTVSAGEVAITACDKLATEVEIPSSINGNPVVSIGAKAFKNCKSLTNVIIPNSITDIGEQAFYNCSSLELISIPDSVENIGQHAFDSCGKIHSVIIGKNVKTIGEAAFRFCESLESVTIPNNVVSIGKGVFYRCKMLKNVTIEDCAISIGAESFLYTSFYEDENNWENGALYINNHLIGVKTTFSGNFKIKEGTLTIGGGAFINCKNISDIEIPESLKVVSGHAFLGCSSLTSIYIPEGVKNIGENAFDSCNNLVEISGLKSVENIGNSAFNGCKDLESFSIPTSLKSLGTAVFSNCTSLKSVALPENEIAEIPISSFYYCFSLTTIYIPSNITAVAEAAFVGCKSLESVYYSGTEEDWNNIIIGNGNNYLENANIYFGHSHIINEWTTVIPVGTYIDGLKIGICSQCSYECNQIIYADHKHNYVASEGKIPNCIENGYVKSICECGDSVVEEIPATGHSKGDWEVVTEAQIGAEGKEVQKCTVCDEVLDEKIIPALPEVSFTPGDANGDGKVNAIDARIILRISAQLDKIENYNLPVAVFDLTGDGKVNAVDARKALRIGAQLE